MANTFRCSPFVFYPPQSHGKQYEYIQLKSNNSPSLFYPHIVTSESSYAPFATKEKEQEQL